MKVEITHDDINCAWRCWFSVSGKTINNASSEFKKVTGIKAFLDNRHIVTEDQARKVRMLLGPHGATLVRAHYAMEKVDGEN